MMLAADPDIFIVIGKSFLELVMIWFVLKLISMSAETRRIKRKSEEFERWRVDYNATHPGGVPIPPNTGAITHW
jgi:hypothetical protein